MDHQAKTPCEMAHGFSLSLGMKLLLHHLSSLCTETSCDVKFPTHLGARPEFPPSSRVGAVSGAEGASPSLGDRLPWVPVAPGMDWVPESDQETDE